MNNLLHVTIGKNAIWYLLILISFGFLGCAGVGQIVPVDNRISFGEKANDEGSFSRWGLTVDYSYSLSGGNMTMAGQVSYPGGADSLDVRIQFLDAVGTVLKQKIVYSSGYRASRDRMAERTFKETLVVPTAATGISFDYSAQPRSSHR